MEPDFWQQRWERGEIGFHESEINSFLKTHFAKLNLAKGSRVFVPLCGKTRDFSWLLANGYRVAGAELSEIAITQLFNELGVEPQVARMEKLTHYSAKDIDIFGGDIFALGSSALGAIDAVYDRAALVALPARMREQYTAHLLDIAGAAPQLLVTYEYNQQLMDGPPFSVSADEVKRHYGAAYHLVPVESREVAGGMKGKVAATETAWILQKPKA
jgi:thiopurine S-methyltransferase